MYKYSYSKGYGNMNYERIYNALMERAKLRDTPAEYTEVHHLYPRSFGGSDDPSNLVSLTAREHFIAHLLLVKMHTGEKRNKMLYALNMMAHCTQGGKRYKVKSSRLYESLRMQYAAMLSESMQGEGNPMYGTSRKGHTKGAIFSKERRIKISKKAKERYKDKTKHPMYGRTQTDEAKKIISEKLQKRMEDTSYRKKLSEASKKTDEMKQKMSKTAKEKYASGYINPNAKKVYAEGIVYDTLLEARKALGLTYYKINKFINDPSNSDFTYI